MTKQTLAHLPTATISRLGLDPDGTGNLEPAPDETLAARFDDTVEFGQAGQHRGATVPESKEPGPTNTVKGRSCYQSLLGR